MQPRFAVALALSLLLATTAAACGSDSEESSSGSDSTSTKAASEGSKSLDGKRLVYVNYGGESGEAAEAAFVKPFAEETGADASFDSPSDIAKVKAMVEADRTVWDVIDFGPASALASCGTLFEKRPESIPVENFNPEFLKGDECGVPINQNVQVMMYNKDKFKSDPPTEPGDFFDLEKYPGTRLLYNLPNNTVEPLLLAAGVAPDDLYPIDWDKVEESLDRLGDDVRFVSTVAEMNDLMQTGNFAMAPWYTSHAALIGDRGTELGAIWDHPFVGRSHAYALKGAKDPDAVEAFLKYVSQPEVQANYTEVLPYMPAVNGGLELVDVKPAWKKWLPALDPDTTAYTDALWWSKNQADAMVRWTELTSK